LFGFGFGSSQNIRIISDSDSDSDPQHCFLAMLRILFWNMNFLNNIGTGTHIFKTSYWGQTPRRIKITDSMVRNTKMLISSKVK
jgi:hypothetical protein